MHIVEGVEFKPLRFERLEGEEKALAHHKRCAAIELPVKGLRSDMQQIAQIASYGLWGGEYMDGWESIFAADAEGFHSMDLCQSAPPSLRRLGTLALLNHMARSAKHRLNDRRQSALDAGRWWPAPSQIVIGYGKNLRVSLVFELKQQTKTQHWNWKWTSKFLDSLDGSKGVK